MYQNCDQGYMGVHFCWWIFWVFILIGLGILFYKLFTKNGKSNSIEILKQRFVKGEISEEGIERKRKCLKMIDPLL